MVEMTIKAARVNAGLNQVEAAQALGICKSTLVNYELYRTIPDIDTALAMANLYGVPVNAIRWSA